MRFANPFRYGKEVGGYQFYDRHDDVRRLCQKLKDGSSNVVMFAPRRYGKTSLVQKVLRQLSVVDGVRGICFDLTKTPTVELFCQSYANAVFEAMKGHGDLMQAFIRQLSIWNPTVSVDVAGVVSFKFHVDVRNDLATESIEQVLNLPERMAHELGDIPFVVAFDEFQEVAQISRKFPLEKIFRSCLQAHQNVRYVFLGSKTHLMKRMFGEETRPFYHSAEPLPLGKPPEDESREFLRTRFEDAGVAIAAEEVEKILVESRNVPYYLQELASGVFEQVAADGRESVRGTDVETTIGDIVARNSELYDVRVGTFSPAKYAIVRALSVEPSASFDEAYRRRHSLPVSSTLHAALRELLESGVVDNDGPNGVYSLTDPFLGRYMVMSPARIFDGISNEKNEQ